MQETVGGKIAWVSTSNRRALIPNDQLWGISQCLKPNLIDLEIGNQSLMALEDFTQWMQKLLPNKRGGHGRAKVATSKSGRGTVTVSLRMTQAQREKLERLGGAKWVRDRMTAPRNLTVIVRTHAAYPAARSE